MTNSRSAFSRACLASLLCCAGLLGAAPAARAQVYGLCGELSSAGQFGPYDYRTIDPETKHKVEDYHFPPKVEALREGNASTIGGDIDYTLRAFQNNPRALLAMSRLGVKLKTERPTGVHFPVECYFDRAIRFTPDDPMPRLLYARYLKDRKRNAAEVQKQLDEAERLRGDPSSFDLDYNLGMLYFEVGAYDKSVEAAKRAYALGAPLPALAQKLKAAGKWRE